MYDNSNKLRDYLDNRVFSSMYQNHNYIIKRLSEATELLSGQPRTEVRGFGIITALRAAKSNSQIQILKMGYKNRNIKLNILLRYNVTKLR